MNFYNGILVLGAGEIGSALAKKIRQLAIEVTLISRPEYNLTQQKEVKRLFDPVETSPSVIVNTISILYNDRHTPEKSLSTFSADWFYGSFRVNSARVSSLSDNQLGGWYSYHASKCVLNMFIKNISIEWSRHFPRVVIYGYHPGTIEMYLTEPF